MRAYEFLILHTSVLDENVVPYLRVLSYNHSLSKAPKLWHFQCNRIVNNVNQIT